LFSAFLLLSVNSRGQIALLMASIIPKDQLLMDILVKMANGRNPSKTE